MTALIVGSSAMLILPWFLGPDARRGGDRPEVRGLLAWLWWVNRGYCAAMHRLVVLDEAPLPERGPAILVANHTSGVDNLVLQAGCRRVLGFLIAREFHEARLIRPLSRLLGGIPVRRDGRDLSATREALRALAEGRVVPIFPEGRITPESGRSIGPGKPGAAFLALRAGGVPVVPAYIRGTPEARTVWEALTTPSRARVLFGPPIDLADLLDARPGEGHDGQKARLDAITGRIMDAIKALRDESLALEASL